MDVESKETINQAIDRAQAAMQQVLATANEDLSKQVHDAAEQLDAVLGANIAKLGSVGATLLGDVSANIGPVLERVDKLTAELAEWRSLFTRGITIKFGDPPK